MNNNKRSLRCRFVDLPGLRPASQASVHSGSLAVSVALVALGVWACGGDVVEANPAPIGGSGGSSGVGGSGGAEFGGSGGSAGSEVGGSGGAEVGGSGGGEVGGSAGSAGAAGGPVVRTVIVRDVFENFDVADNLMLDGGFELSGEMASTWAAYGGNLKFGNGAACRTGVRCGVAAQNEPIFGFFVSPKAGSMEISLRTKTDGAACDSMTVAVFDSYSQNQGTMVSLTSSLESDGWCLLTGTTAALNLATPLLYLEPTHGKANIDDVAIRAVSSTTALSMAPAAPLPAALQARAKVVRAQAAAILQNRPGTRRSPRAGAPWTAQFDPWIR